MMTYHQRKLDAFLESDPVKKTLEIRLLGQLGRPVSTLPRLRTVTDAVTALVTLLREAGMVAGRVEPEDLFTLGFDRITTTLEKLHKYSGILVGITPAQCNLPLAAYVMRPSIKSQMTLKDIEVHPQTQEKIWHPWSMPDPPSVTRSPRDQVREVFYTGVIDF